MAVNGGNDALTGLFGAYASDDEEMSGSGAEDGAAPDTEMPDLAGDDSDADAGLSVLLTPPALPDVPSVANLAPTDQENLGQSPEQRNGEVEGGSGSDASPSQTNSRPQLPPELAEPPPGPVDPMVQENVRRVLLGKQRSGKLYTEELRRIRAYRNPDFLQKMVEFFGIQDQGTCFPKDIFDPSSLPKSDFYTELNKEWNAEMERRQQLRAKAGPQFQKGPTELDRRLPQGLTVPAAGASRQAMAIVAQAKAQAQALTASAVSKRSKWDTAPRR